MKYMGSKRAMLTNGLGDVIRAEAQKADRFVDLFCGSGAVSWFAAQHTALPVYAVDLQSYATSLAAGVITRTRVVDVDELMSEWFRNVRRRRMRCREWELAKKLDNKRFNTATWAKRARELCANRTPDIGSVWNAYGGYYFSPTQALTLDVMRDCIPDTGVRRAICLAATIITASKCAAAPGHTAQPFRPTRTASVYLREAWLRDPFEYATVAMRTIGESCAQIRGKTRTGDALKLASELLPTDLAFVDPPYSDVHYSRFYHVLETIARGRCGVVAGAGRYPPVAERPMSGFSRKTESLSALKSLLDALACAKCRVIVTFPAGQSSNGLSGNDVVELSREKFCVDKCSVHGEFSTLGGNNGNRPARHRSDELILVLSPR